MTRQRRYPQEVRERAVRMVLERGVENGSQWSAGRLRHDKVTVNGWRDSLMYAVVRDE